MKTSKMKTSKVKCRKFILRQCVFDSLYIYTHYLTGFIYIYIIYTSNHG